MSITGEPQHISAQSDEHYILGGTGSDTFEQFGWGGEGRRREMSLYPFEDDYQMPPCKTHGRYDCDECAAAARATIRQIEHELSVQRQKAKLKILDRSELL